jgi:OPA family glycerol-3-phosphate transporter-like MFS transporter
LPELPQHDDAFRRRRGINWFTLGLTYATFYMGRYNFSVAQKSLSDEFGWSKGDVGWILTAGFAVYGISTVVNGPLTDRFGGRRVLLVGTAGAAVCNLLFGLGSFFGVGARSWLLGYLATSFALNNYFQSFGACAIVKVNAGWFQLRERGVFGGIFGAMIQGGRALTYAVSGPLIAWFSWKWGFFLPSVLLTVIFFAVWRNVQDTPEAAGLPPLDTGDGSGHIEGRVPFGYLLRRVFTNPIMLTLTLASFCIGFSRQGLDQWMARYFQEVHHLTALSLKFQLLGWGAPLFGVAGGLLAGTASDRLFGSRRPPVIFFFFLGQLLSFGLLSRAVGPWSALGAILGASLCINACHSMIAGVASMDFGGKYAAGSAAGIIDGVQYLAGALTGHWMGNWLERYGWGNWAYMLMPTALVGACLMATIWRADPRRQAAAATA